MKKNFALSLAFLALLAFVSGCAPSGAVSSGAAATEAAAAAATQAATQAATEAATGAAEAVSELNAANGTLDPSNPTAITFYSYSLAQATMRPGMERLIQDFNDTVGKEKGVIVEPIATSANRSPQGDIAAGEPVHVIQNVFATLDVAKESLGAKTYEELFPAAELSEHLSHMYPNAVELGKIDGMLYSLAFTFSTPILYINGDMFEAAGLDPANPPKTWEDVAASSAKIFEATGKPGFALFPENVWNTEGILFSNGADMMNEERTEAVFASPEGVAAVQMWQDLYASGSHAMGNNEELNEQFRSGNLGMLIQSSANLSGMKGAADAGGWTLYGSGMPQFGDTPAVPVNSGSALVVRSESAQESLAIWEFIQYITGPVGYTIITSEIGYLPLNKDIVDDPAYLKPFIDENPIVRTNLDQLANLRPVTIWPAEFASEFQQIFCGAVGKAVTTTEPVAAILEEAQNSINERLGA